MEATNDIIARYPFTQAQFLEFIRIIYLCYSNDIADFILFDPTMGEAFKTMLETLIVEAEAIPTDDQIRDEVALATSIVDERMVLLRNVIQAFKHFIEKTFPDQSHIWNVFGYNDYDEARKSQPLLIMFMRTFIRVTKHYEQELLAAGTPQDNIDKLQTVLDDLVEANDNQEFAKKQRIIKTQDRIVKFNEVWDQFSKVCKTGKIVYYNNPAKYKQYLLYQGAGQGSDILTGTVPAGQTVVILDENITAETNFVLHNTDTTILQFCLEDTHDPCTGGVQLDAGEEKEISAADLGSGSILKCTNLAAEEEGAYEVEIS